MPVFRLRRTLLPVALLALGSLSLAPARVSFAQATVAAPARPYYPAPGSAWERRRPADVGVDSAKLAEAVAFAQSREIAWSKEMAEQLARNTARERWPEILGPYKDRGTQNGIILKGGYIVAEWGDTERVDMTFSVAKSYLATVAGLALDRGLIRDMQEPIGRTVKDGGYDSPHNARITWHQAFNQTSEWEGTLWGKPDSADRRTGIERALREPGTYWEYNDVRVNRAALSLLRLFNRPLPDVLREGIMHPIGASDTWVWHGYRNAFVEIDGKRMQSVSGGGHWGGGVWASTRDHARFGYLMLRRGKWGDRQLLSEKWIDLATTPTPIRPVYGYMWWLNTDGRQFAGATPKSFFALGAGGNTIWIAPELDLVVVTRWLDNAATSDFMRRVVEAMRG